MGKQSKQWDFIFLGSKITADGDCNHEIKRHLLLGRKAMFNLDSILKSNDISLLTKVCIIKAMVFLIVMYGYESWTIKKSEYRIDAFGLEKTFESPLDCKEINPVNSKGIQSWIFIGRLMLKLQYFGHLMQRANSLGKCLMLGKIEGRRRRGRQRMRWWMASPTQWTWVWASCRSWGWTGRPCVLQSMGSQRVGHDWATELNCEWVWVFRKKKVMNGSDSVRVLSDVYYQGKSSSENDTCYLRLSVWHSGECKNYRYSKEKSGCQGLGGEVGWRSMNRQKKGDV